MLMAGRTSVKVTVASAVADVGLPSLSAPPAVTVSSWAGPEASPVSVKVCVNAHEARAGRMVPTVQSASPVSVKSVSASEVIVSGSAADVLVTVKVKVTGPPGSGRLAGSGVLVTLMVGRTSVSVTLASSVAVAGLLSSSLAVAVTTSVWLAPRRPLKVPVKAQL